MPARRQDAPEGRPDGGDIYLEGAVIGRWFTERMTREASRPTTGSTAFDPRLTPAWPGAPIG
jgi:hypothetical protein